MEPELALDINPLLGTIRCCSKQLEDSNLFNPPMLGAAFKNPHYTDEETETQRKSNVS